MYVISWPTGQFGDEVIAKYKKYKCGSDMLTSTSRTLWLMIISFVCWSQNQEILNLARISPNQVTIQKTFVQHTNIDRGEEINILFLMHDPKKDDWLI
jgi:hypothetical protein